MKQALTIVVFAFLSYIGFSQEDQSSQKSNIQTYTPSKLLNKGQWDIKWFNNLYTETKGINNGVKADMLRQTFFTSSLDVFTGVSNSNRLNLGLLLEIRSNTFAGRGALEVFQFDDNPQTARSGLTSFAPALKFNPIKGVGNFTVQTAFHIPLIDNESENDVYLDQTAYTLQNRLFYDYTFPDGQWQLFTELNTEYNFGDEDSFANKTFVFAPGVFMSYFQNQEFTILGFLQHQQRFGDFKQDYTAMGGGAKYQLTRVLNLEVLYSKFIRGNDTGLGQSFNLGLRALF